MKFNARTSRTYADPVTTEGGIYASHLNPVAELDSTGAIRKVFVYGAHGNVPDYYVDLVGGGTYRFVTDPRGSVRLVINVSTGATAQTLEYDPFGVVLNETGTLGLTPFGFAGGLYDRETGLVRFGARDYDATTGRWTAKDPILFGGGDPNLYAYVGSDPINYIDPSGLVIDTVVDVGFIAYDIYNIATCGATGANLLALGLDILIRRELVALAKPEILRPRELQVAELSAAGLTRCQLGPLLGTVDDAYRDELVRSLLAKVRCDSLEDLVDALDAASVHEHSGA